MALSKHSLTTHHMTSSYDISQEEDEDDGDVSIADSPPPEADSAAAAAAATAPPTTSTPIGQTYSARSILGEKAMIYQLMLVILFLHFSHSTE
jgi:hypothetical protein